MEGSFSLILQALWRASEVSELPQPEAKELSFHILAPRGGVNFPLFSVPAGRPSPIAGGQSSKGKLEVQPQPPGGGGGGRPDTT